ncbi:cilia- and flagella-associated protein 100 [Electrophorus electricus]|uniref:cilia- and flagella-associated protein 100 n=1 Tax=Electrophorus electricus TaxID=8005 RepID=UPI0015D08C81|nr:cilia- and flagella-associated protein 100 [Electrophorus electricus]
MLLSVPATQKSGSHGVRTQQNPFVIPKDNMFLIRNTEKAQKKTRELQLPVHEKMTYKGRMRARQSELRKTLREDLEEEKDHAPTHPRTTAQLLQDTPACKFVMRNHNIGKDTVREFINGKRELFYLEHTLAIKREQIQQLKEVSDREKEELARAEKHLEEDNILFEAFLLESHTNAMEAIELAEQESNAKMEKLDEIRRITAKIMAIKSDIAQYEEILQEYKHYKDVLFKLSPPEWQEIQRAKKRGSNSASSVSEKESEGKSSETKTGKKTSLPDIRREKSSTGSRELLPLREARAPSRHSVKSTLQNSSKMSSPFETDSSDSEEEPELYFTEPQQLLHIQKELREQNLSLLENVKEIEESLEELTRTVEQTENNMEHEISQRKQQIDAIMKTIKEEKERTAEIEVKVKMANFGQNKTKEDIALNILGRKVEELYRSFTGDMLANLGTVHMLMAIEGKLLMLLDNIEMIPADKVNMAVRAREKERKLRLQEEKLFLQKQHQEQRRKKALERAQAEIKRMTGRKLMPRSLPPLRKPKNNQQDDIIDKEKEDYLYFFT